MLGCNVLVAKRLLGHANLMQMNDYAEVAERFLAGEARALQRDIIRVLCPGLPSRLVDRAFPESRAVFGALLETLPSRHATPGSLLPVEDVLFSGVLTSWPGAWRRTELPMGTTTERVAKCPAQARKHHFPCVVFLNIFRSDSPCF